MKNEERCKSKKRKKWNIHEEKVRYWSFAQWLGSVGVGRLSGSALKDRSSHP